MKLYLEKDGRFWKAENEGARVEVREGPVGGDSEDVRTAAHADEEAAQEALAQEARRRMADGWGILEAPEDRWRPEPVIGEWFASEAFAMLQAANDAQPCEPDDTPERLVEVHGMAMPPELERFLRWRSSHAIGYTNVGEWRIWPDDKWIPRAEHGNLFEQLVLMEQRNYLSTALQEVCAGLVCIGTAGNGDVYLAALSHTDPGSATVVLWDHEEQSPNPFADGISTLAWVNKVYLDVESGEFDPADLKRDMGRVADRASLSWHYSSQVEESEVEPSYDVRVQNLYYYYRTLYIRQLFRTTSLDAVPRIADVYFEQIHDNARFDETVAGPFLTTLAPTALYWLWRLFFFRKDTQLEQCLALCEAHPSSAVRDAVALIREIGEGRKQLGAIEDIHALRDAFVELDLDPDRALERAAEQAAAEAAAEAKRQEAVAKAEALVASREPTALPAAAWELVGIRDALAVVYQAVEDGVPALKPHFDRLRFLTEGGASRDGRSYSHENAEVEEALVHEPSVVALLPLIVQADRPVLAARIAARAGGDAIAHVRPWLESLAAERNEYHHREDRGVQGLTALGAADLLPLFTTMLGELQWTDTIQGIKNESICHSLIDALSHLGGADQVSVLQGVLEHGPDKLHARAIVGLGQLGGDDAASALLPQLDGKHPLAACYALAHTGSQRALAALTERVAVEVGGGPALAFERVMLQRARHGVGEPVDTAVLKAAALVVPDSKWPDIELHETLQELLPAADDRGWAVQTALAALEHDQPRVRAAARVALANMDALPALRYADRPVVDTAFVEGGEAVLVAGLSDPHVVFRQNFLRKAAEEGCRSDALVDAAVDWARQGPFRFTAYTGGYASYKHKRSGYALEDLSKLEHAVADRLLGELLVHPMIMYRQLDTLKYDRNGVKTRVEGLAVPPLAEEPLDLGLAPIGESHWVVGRGSNGLAWSPDGAWLAVASEGGVRLFDRDGKLERVFESTANGWIYDVAWHPEGRFVAMGAHAGHLQLLDPETGACMARLEGHRGVPNGVRKLAFSPSGARLASVSDDDSLRVWDVDTVSLSDGPPTVLSERWSAMDKADVNGVAWLDEDTVVTITDRMVHVHPVGSVAPELSLPKMGGADVVVDSAHGRIYAGTKGRIAVLDRSGELTEELAQASVARLRLSADGQTLFAGSYEGDDQGVWAWDLQTKERVLLGHAERPVFALDLDPRTGAVCAAGKSEIIHRWLAGEPLVSDGLAHSNEVNALVRDGDTLWSGSDDGQVIQWEGDHAMRALQRASGGRIEGVARMGDRLVVTGANGATAFHARTGEELWHQPELGRSEFLASAEDAVVVADGDRLAWIAVDDGRVLHRTESFSKSFLFWSHRLDARRLVCAGYEDQHLFVWDVQTRELLTTHALPAGVSDRARMNGLGGDATRLVVSRWDKTIVVLEAETGVLSARIRTRHALANPTLGADHLVAGESGLTVFDAHSWERLGAVEVPDAVTQMRFTGPRELVLGTKSGGLLRATLPD